MQRNYFDLPEAYPLSTPGNTGGGIKILQKAGADPWQLRNHDKSSGQIVATIVEVQRAR
ncbi:MAG: hypothetical protein ABIT36_04945 [Steroidobacteraceae bacterium]